MHKILYTNNSAAGLGEKMQENLDRILDNSRRWSEILAFEIGRAHV